LLHGLDAERVVNNPDNRRSRKLKAPTAPLAGRYAVPSGQAYRHDKAAQLADLKQVITHLFNDANRYSNCFTLKDGHERKLIRMGSDVITSIETYPAGLLIQKKKKLKKIIFK
jgi:hypothetical protein